MAANPYETQGRAAKVASLCAAADTFVKLRLTERQLTSEDRPFFLDALADMLDGLKGDSLRRAAWTALLAEAHGGGRHHRPPSAETQDRVVKGVREMAVFAAAVPDDVFATLGSGW